MDIKAEIQHIFDSGANEIRIEVLCEQYANHRVLEELDNVGKTLFEKVGTDSYQSRCVIHDRKAEIKNTVQ